MMFPFVKEAISQLFSKPSTEKYPFVKKEAPDGFRGRIAFHPDTCINCGMCIKVCSPGAITKTVVKTGEGDEITMTFDLSSCTFCQMCADFCSKKSIEMTKDYSMIGQVPEDLLVSGTFIKKAPVKKAKPAAAAKPAAPAAPAAPKAEEVKPVEVAPKADEVKPVEVAPKAEEVKPVEAPKAEEVKPVEVAPKAEEVKPVEVAPKAEEVKPVEEAPKAEEVKPVEEAPKVEEVKPVEEAPKTEEVKPVEETPKAEQLDTSIQQDYKNKYKQDGIGNTFISSCFLFWSENCSILPMKIDYFYINTLQKESYVV